MGSIPENLTNYITCLSLFETKSAKLYYDLSEKVDLPLIKSLLMEISLDSQKHATLLRGVGESLPKADRNPQECAEKIGESWNATEELIRELAATPKISAIDLPVLVQKLDSLESVMGEEYYVFVEMKTLEVLAKEINNSYNVSLEGVQSIFASILDDEERHQEVLALIRELIKKKEQEMIAADPLLEYRRIGVPTQ